MNWLQKLFQSFKSRDPTGPKEAISGYDTNIRLVENDGQYQIVNDNVELYDSELSRACIHRIATECSKGTPRTVKPNRRIEYLIAKRPNTYQSVSQFIEQVITITLTDNNCFVVPVLDWTDTVTGLWAVSPRNAHWTDVDGRIYLEYQIPGSGQNLLIESERVGQMRRMVRDNALTGESNAPFYDAAKLYDTNTQRSINLLEANREPIRWKAKLNQTIASNDNAKILENLASVNKIAVKTGVMVTDARYESFEPFQRSISVMKPEDVQEMRKATYIYWGCSEDILTNHYSEDVWNGFYQSALQPLLIQLGQVLTKIFYTENQIKDGNEIYVDSDRIQYASVKSKIQVAFGAYDRGLTTKNQSLGILDLDLIPGPEGDERNIRGEYKLTNERGFEDNEQDEAGSNQNDDGGSESSRTRSEKEGRE